MADMKLSELVAAGQLDANDLLLITDTATGTSQRITGQQVLDYVEGNIDIPTGISDISGLQAALDDKANVTHTHIINDVTGLQTALDSKYDSSTAGITGNTIIIGGNAINVVDVVDDRVADITGVSPTDGRIPTSVTPNNFLQFTSSDGSIGEVTEQQLKADLLINNVDNTTDLDKPISSAVQDALDDKVSNTFFSDDKDAQDALIAVNTAKNGVTDEQSAAITANTAKRSYPQADEDKLSGVESGADVTDTANVWPALGISTAGSTGRVLTERGIFVNASEVPTNITKASVDGALTGLGANTVLKMNADNNEVEGSSITDEGSGIVKIAEITPQTPKTDGYVVVTADGTLGTASGANPATTLPPNVVTTDTAQTISGEKTLTNSLSANSSYGTINRANWIAPVTVGQEIISSSSVRYELGNAVDNIDNAIGFIFPAGFTLLGGVGNDAIGTLESPAIVGSVIPVAGTSGLSIDSYDNSTGFLVISSVGGEDFGGGVNLVQPFAFIVNTETSQTTDNKITLEALEQGNIDDERYLGLDADGNIVRSVRSQKGISSATRTISVDYSNLPELGRTPNIFVSVGFGIFNFTSNDGILELGWNINNQFKPPFVDFYNDNVTEFVISSFQFDGGDEVDLADLSQNFRIWMEDTDSVRWLRIDFRTASNGTSISPSIMTNQLNTWFTRCTAEVKVPVINNSAEFADSITVQRGITSNQNISVPDGIGINFGDTTSDITSKTLDDYEEGTWTPAARNFIAADGSTDFIQNVNLIGNYTKSGNIVSINGTFSIPENSDTSNISIEGLPYAPSATSYGGYAIGNTSGGQSGISVINISPTASFSTGGIDNLTYQDYSDPVFSLAIFSATYITD